VLLIAKTFCYYPISFRSQYCTMATSLDESMRCRPHKSVNRTFQKVLQEDETQQPTVGKRLRKYYKGHDEAESAMPLSENLVLMRNQTCTVAADSDRNAVTKKAVKRTLRFVLRQCLLLLLLLVLLLLLQLEFDADAIVNRANRCCDI
jgi:hypothetical protein